jgi:predicted Fe-Mo cluster-binding NifX family protein
MKIAVPVTEQNQVDNHFGHCNFYDIFVVTADKRITEWKRIPSLQGCGCKSNIAELLAADGVTTMLAGGIGNGAVNVLENAGIKVIRGCAGDSAEVVKRYLLGVLTDSGENCSHPHNHPTGDNNHQCSH